MTRTIVIPLSDPRQDEEGIAEQAIVCTYMLVGDRDARILLTSVIADEGESGTRQAYLDHIAGTIGGPVDTMIEIGDPAARILAITDRVEDPIIVMASHGRRGAQLRIFGSVAMAVARDASCPVMILPASPATQAPICHLIERVLLPIDDPSSSDAIITATLAELGTDRARKIAFHLLDVSVPIPPQPAVAGGEQYVDAHEVPAHFLRRVAESLQARGISASWDLRIGNPAQEITRFATEQNINLIIMPAHTRHGFNSLVPDIFAAQVRTPEPVPVLLVQANIDRS